MTACPKPIKERKKKKIKKKSQRKIGKAICVKLAKKIVRDYSGKCEMCGKKKSAGWQLHGSHIIPVQFGHTAADTDNILCLCASCHSMGRESMHQNPIKFALWLGENFPGLYETLKEKSNRTEKVDWPLVYENLLVEAEQLGVKP